MFEDLMIFYTFVSVKYNASKLQKFLILSYNKYEPKVLQKLRL